jgi:hypothetical protein
MVCWFQLGMGLEPFELQESRVWFQQGTVARNHIFSDRLVSEGALALQSVAVVGHVLVPR